MHRLSVLLILFLAIGCHLPQAAALTTAVVETGEASHELVLEVADHPQARRQGLMHREALAEGVDGMLFVFDDARRRSMWMKNTPLSLDILFLDARGRVTTIHRETEPFSERTLASDGPAKAAIELLAGRAQRLGISIGDRVRHAVFKRPGGG